MLIKKHEVEFISDIHCYLVDGIVTPSVTQLLKIRFGGKYNGVSEKVLNNAAEKGTAMHKAIEMYEKQGIENECKELRNYKFLKKLHSFECLGNEIPLIIFGKNEQPIACGTTDLLLKEGNLIGLGDLKRTATLDKEYLAFQLNLYRIGYQQCYKQEISFLRGIHLREDKRKYVQIPINEEMAWNLIEEYKAKEKNDTNNN